MVDNFKFVISAIGGAFVTGFFGLWLQKMKNSGDHYIENVDKINALVSERSDLIKNNTVLEIKLKHVQDDLRTQRKVTDELTKQIGELKREMNQEEK